MHERSLVNTLIEQVKEAAKVRGLGRIHEIHLQIGEFSGVEPRLFESAFEEMAPACWDTEVHLTIEVVPLTAKCTICNDVFHVEGFCFICPQCGGKVHVIAGEEMRLVSLGAECQTRTEGLSQ